MKNNKLHTKLYKGKKYERQKKTCLNMLKKVKAPATLH